MSTDMDLIKQLRAKTGVGIGKCKDALQAASNDLEGAIDFLRKQGMATAVKRQGRETHEGAIAFGETEETVALVELNAETDFVAQNDRFENFLHTLAKQVAQELPHSLEELLERPFEGDASLSVDQYRATLVQSLGENIQLRRFDAFAKGVSHSIGMHVAASAPEFLDPDSVPETVLEKEREIARSQMQGKPPHILEGIVTGKVRAFCQTACLSEQEFIKEPNLLVKDLVARKAKATGEALQLAHFVRWCVAD